ncbi:CSC1-like protein 2 isoform X2 [Xyrichtys novacula]|uniref:CSC1-like protein 2 isoform X2 n=1 Tax=Xyrichtys novacula TaxID=13765 RepID=A0AAV1G5T0_XYRNO|nr:CSC1-like protein 2 isoform X2 [Xyrichtys novacula]
MCYRQKFKDEFKEPPLVVILDCASCPHSHPHSQREKAVSYYTKLEAQLKDDYRKEREKVNRKPLGMAFVTFQNEAITAIILKDFNACKCKGCQCRREPKISQFSAKLHTHNWTVSYAPDPQNVYWEHLSVGGAFCRLRFLSINIVLFLLLFFLTTPAIIISTMDKFNVTKPVEYLNNPIITQFFPTLLLWSFSALLPTIVYYSAFFEAHWTRSGENRTTMHKCYTFLIFMVLLLPSLGLSSLDVFFRWLFDTRFLDLATVRFQCVFLPDNGAFFVNYVIASGLLMYMIRLCLARSAAERRNVKRVSVSEETRAGVAYAWMMCVFSVVMTYSITCPVIVPFGLMYMLLKHQADKYNMFYADLPTKLDKKIHSGAVNQVVAAPILCLFWLLFFLTVRSGFSAATSMFTVIVLIITIIICLSHVCFGHLKYLSAHNYKIDNQVDSQVGWFSCVPLGSGDVLVSINIVLFLLLFFLTTPAIIISTMDKFNVTKPVEYLNNPIITQFFPTLVLWSFSALLPTIVYYSAFFEAHWTRSGENRTTMHKCYTFLIFMVLLLPSLGLSRCVFLPDNGAFFVNYIIASAFIGFSVATSMFTVIVLIITIIVCLSHVCFGHFKYLSAHNYKIDNQVDSQVAKLHLSGTSGHNLEEGGSGSGEDDGQGSSLEEEIINVENSLTEDFYYYYLYYGEDSLIDQEKIHSGAVNQVVAAPILCLFWLLFFLTVRSGFSAATFMFTFIVLIITIIICLSHVCFGHFKYLSAHNYKVKLSLCQR